MFESISCLSREVATKGLHLKVFVSTHHSLDVATIAKFCENNEEEVKQTSFQTNSRQEKVVQSVFNFSSSKTLIQLFQSIMGLAQCVHKSYSLLLDFTGQFRLKFSSIFKKLTLSAVVVLFMTRGRFVEQILMLSSSFRCD